jgi:hypothetical protein
VKHLVKYDPAAQHYGTWLRGYDWSIYGCGTFRMQESEGRALALGKRFFERLERRLRANVSYAGVLEHRYSGCGLSPIPVHWHFLAASTALPKDMAAMAQVTWQQYFGNAQIQTYDANGEAAYYVAKLAAHQNGMLVVGKLERMEYQGPSDLLAAAELNPYVPDHLKSRVFGEYLVTRP